MSASYTEEQFLQLLDIAIAKGIRQIGILNGRLVDSSNAKPFISYKASKDLLHSLSNIIQGEKTFFYIKEIVDILLSRDISITTSIINMLEIAIAKKATDIHIGSCIYFRINKNLHLQDISHTDIRLKLIALIAKDYLDSMMDKKEISITLNLANDSKTIKCRVSAFSKDSIISVAIRILQTTIPSLESIKAPRILQHLSMKDNGLIIVCGATGSGKSTTIAAMIDFINKTCNKHILTIEDPIEYEHVAHKSLINQREIGRDSKDFKSALKASLRQDPDIILIGEILDAEVLKLAINHALSGHLVFTSFHANSAYHAISRMIGMCKDDPNICINIADSLCAIISQRLYMENDTMQADYEILVSTPAVKTLINENKINQLNSQISMGREYGMQHFSKNAN